MRALVLVLSLFALPAWAQDVGATMYVAADTASTRFLDAETPGPALKTGDEVTVLAVEAGLVRVMAGARYGWVAPTALTATDPTPEPIRLGGAGGLPTEFSMEELQKLLDRTKAP